MKTISEITTEFFKRRFTDKNIENEKRYGYFQEWEGRFKTTCPEHYMDEHSKKVWKEMQSWIKE